MAQDLFYHEYENEWEIGLVPDGKPFQTPLFSPIPNLNFVFCFEMTYRKCVFKEEESSRFQICLKPVFDDKALPRLKNKVTISVFYHEKGRKVAQYIRLDHQSVVNAGCLKPALTPVSYNGILTDHGRKISNGSLIVACHLACYGQHGAESWNHQEMRSFSTLSDLGKNMRAMYESKIFSDLTINVGNGTLLAHKAILAARSPILMKMLQPDSVELKNNSITITDASCGTFDCFLKCLYSLEIEEHVKPEADKLYILADKYEVKILRRKCAEVIVSNLTIESVCEVLKLVYDCNYSDLKERVISFAARRFFKFIYTEKWNKFVKCHPLIGYEVSADAYVQEKRNFIEYITKSN